MGSRQKRRKRRAEARKRKAAQNSQQGANGQGGLNSGPLDGDYGDSQGGVEHPSNPTHQSSSQSRLDSDVVSDPRRYRSDARMASHLLSLGVIPLDDAEELYRRAARGAVLCADAGRWSSYASLIRLLQSGAKIELDALTLAQRGNAGALMPEAPDGRTIDADSVAFLEAPSHDDLRDTARVLSDLGILDRMRDTED